MLEHFIQCLFPGEMIAYLNKRPAYRDACSALPVRDIVIIKAAMEKISRLSQNVTCYII